MNKDRKRGAGRNVKGRIKEAAGVVSGDKKLEADGMKDRVVGAARYFAGAAKHAVAKKLDS